MHFSLFEYNFVYLSLAYRTKRYRKYQNIHSLFFHLRAIFSEPGSSSQHGKPFLLKGNFISGMYWHLHNMASHSFKEFFFLKHLLKNLLYEKFPL